MAEVSLLPSLWASSVSTTVLTILLHSRLSLTTWIVKNFFPVPCISSKPSWIMGSLMGNCPSQISRITWWSSSGIVWSTIPFGDCSKWNPCMWGILNLHVFQPILWANFYCCPHLLMTLLRPASPFLNLKLGQLTNTGYGRGFSSQFECSRCHCTEVHKLMCCEHQEERIHYSLIFWESVILFGLSFQGKSPLPLRLAVLSWCLEPCNIDHLSLGQVLSDNDLGVVVIFCPCLSVFRRNVLIGSRHSPIYNWAQFSELEDPPDLVFPSCPICVIQEFRDLGDGCQSAWINKLELWIENFSEFGYSVMRSV